MARGEVQFLGFIKGRIFSLYSNTTARIAPNCMATVKVLGFAVASGR